MPASTGPPAVAAGDALRHDRTGTSSLPFFVTRKVKATLRNRKNLMNKEANAMQHRNFRNPSRSFEPRKKRR
ncbi:MAG: hypothetical protein HSCHL_2186 [Hydrogenibacillus schlegelii]|uniref:Uncharacterized protein n=1 Tax=Hydrogenibacillus schlegelii TaxID=1484 RepID=A0A2T5GA20_HYDSH|nr:MAG: hypothetical protein HSCHL_2186 [Hydrogenibacillus schlegelii]